MAYETLNVDGEGVWIEYILYTIFFWTKIEVAMVSKMV